MTIYREDLEPRFKFQVAELPEGENVKECFACGSCTGACPVSQIIPEFDPRKILHMISLGLKKHLLSSDLFWYCTGCSTCKFVCPQDVRFNDVIKALKVLALQDGYVDADTLSEMGKLAVVNERRCVGCLTCVRLCPFSAPSIEEGKGVAYIEPLKCVSCGICVVECPVKAIELKISEDVRRFNSFELLRPAEWGEPNIVAFCCHYTAYACSQDLQNLPKLGFPENVHVEIVHCSGSISINRLLKAFEEGADGVYVAGCLEDTCHNVKGSQIASNRVNYVRNILSQLNLDSSRIEMYMISREPNRGFIDVAKDMTERIKILGPSPLKGK
ncbi:MAG: hydrogenase iron-sulfur subunit [Proteobacteria bacterium]|nr:hydrogenase iron-sulfur subunit [Pseudomonadota bacterium]MBU4288567.1 hydrogenase iron-sulfur subunit [Pseudomonadota bacterium]MBU4413789.1 hydrogenase iron-sulfur subunit [Pseudomonadota bacterium]MCG2757531.1 hydrogenase iron-sulfur subunit [Desulfobacteraceae bacterium]